MPLQHVEHREPLQCDDNRRSDLHWDDKRRRLAGKISLWTNKGRRLVIFHADHFGHSWLDATTQNENGGCWFEEMIFLCTIGKAYALPPHIIMVSYVELVVYDGGFVLY